LIRRRRRRRQQRRAWHECGRGGAPQNLKELAPRARA